MAGPRRPALAACLLAVLLLAGCSSADPGGLACPATNTVARVTSIDGDTVQVELLQSSQGRGPATLHTAGARFYVQAGSLDQCEEAARDVLAVGQEIDFFADLWMESYPPQAHVDAILVRG